MTRINANLDPALLHRRHLVAELREITMVPAALTRSLRTKSKADILSSIPSKFTLNAGHVRFFYNKQIFLQNRFNALCNEMVRRGYNCDRSRASAFLNFDKEFYNDWAASRDDTELIQARIAERINKKPHLYL